MIRRTERAAREFDTEHGRQAVNDHKALCLSILQDAAVLLSSRTAHTFTVREGGAGYALWCGKANLTGWTTAERVTADLQVRLDAIKCNTRTQSITRI
jgi:hypothetical protein